MALPPDLTTVRVTGSFVDATGAACTGSVTFALSGPLYDRSNKVIVEPTVVVAPLVAGAITVDLPATDDPDLVPGGNSYTVTITLAGVSSKTFTLLLPAQTIGAIDLSGVIPIDGGGASTSPVYLQLRLDAMQDLDLTGLTDGSVISYDTTAKKFKVAAATNSTALVRYSVATLTYPARPTTATTVIWEGPTAPTSPLDGDLWIQTP